MIPPAPPLRKLTPDELTPGEIAPDGIGTGGVSRDVCDDMKDALDELHRRFDGTPPRLALRAARAGGIGPWASLLARAAQARAARDCAETRAAVARRRTGLRDPAGDAWLCRLVAELAAARGRAVPSGQSRVCEPSQSGDRAVALQPQKKTVRDVSAS